jgi:hypothetical protein
VPTINFALRAAFEKHFLLCQRNFSNACRRECVRAWRHRKRLELFHEENQQGRCRTLRDHQGILVLCAFLFVPFFLAIAFVLYVSLSLTNTCFLPAVWQQSPCVLFRIETEGLQSPVSISFLSVYPHEDERLSPPLTRIKLNKHGKKLVKWVEVSQENRRKSRVLSEENERLVSAVKEMLVSTSPSKQESHWGNVPSDEAVCVKVDGKYYQPLFEYSMVIQF